MATDDHRSLLIAFGHDTWGFDGWNWTLTKQELDFVDRDDGEYTAGVASFVKVTVNSAGVQREDVGYATVASHRKGSAIRRARKASVTNALRETLMSFGGAVAAQLSERFDSEFKQNTFNAPSSMQNCSGDSSASIENAKLLRLDTDSSFTHQTLNARNVPAPYCNEPLQFPGNRMIVKPNGFSANQIMKPLDTSVRPPSITVAEHRNMEAPVSTLNIYPPDFITDVPDKYDDNSVRAERLRRQKQKMEEFKTKHMQGK